MAANIIWILSAHQLFTCPILVSFFLPGLKQYSVRKKTQWNLWNKSTMITYPHWDSNGYPCQQDWMSRPLICTAVRMARIHAPLWQWYFSSVCPGAMKCVPGTLYIVIGRLISYPSGPLILISDVLIVSIRGRQLICLNAMSMLQHFILSQIHHSQSSGHQIIWKLRLCWQITRTGTRQSVTVTHSYTLSSMIGCSRQCEREKVRNERKLHLEELRNFYPS
jgi:hypothetical protein